MKPAVIPTIGRVVLYCLSEDDAREINRRRTSVGEIHEQIQNKTWPLGAQAHLGNKVYEGDVYPGLVVRVFGEDSINIKVELDGTDQFWATTKSVSEGPVPGYFHWMPYQLQQAAK